MAPDAINRDADQLRIKSVKLRQELIVESHLVPAHRAPIGRVERQDDWLAAKITQRDTLIGRAMQREVGCQGAGSERCRWMMNCWLFVVLVHKNLRPPQDQDWLDRCHGTSGRTKESLSPSLRLRLGCDPDT